MSLRGRAGGRAARRHAALSLLWAALVVNGCAPGQARPPGSTTPAPPTSGARPKPGYDQRVDDLASVDAAALNGRRIALDPGHGGFFRGALGVKGLTEAETNLGVALHLRGLLEARGAVVFMTRTDDRDFLTPADSTLRSDLAERTRLANAFGPDLFISIHHNADARGSHDVNEIQTYYKLGDDGPSLDAAASIHRYLVRNLGIDKHRILPGNFHVLRNSAGPGLLTESSYITNPDVESKLALAAKQRLEAEALLLGIADFFARPRPVVEEFRAYAEGYPGVDSAFIDPFLMVRARVRGAFDEVELRLDGVPVTPFVRDGAIDWTPTSPLPVGMHEATLRVRLAGSGAAPTRTIRFHVASWTDRIIAEFPDQVVWNGEQPLGLRVRILDNGGLVYRDSVNVRVRDVGTSALAPADTQIVVKDGAGWVYFRASSRKVAKRPHQPTSVAVEVGLWPRVKGEAGDDITAPVTARIASGLSRTPPVRTAMAIRMPDGEPLVSAPGTTGLEPRLEWINRDGFVRLWRDSSGAVRVPRLAGYRRWPSKTDWPPRFVAIAGGALHGKRIVIDPDGGGENDAGTGRSGTRAANLNLDVARALASFLEASGAEVRLTREGDVALSEVERVQISEAFRADRFIRIGHRAQPPTLGYYFSSAPGKRWAERTAATLTSLGLPAPALAEDAQYPLQQTSCPALYVGAARIDEPKSEARYASPAVARAEAYALYVALAGDWSDQTWPLDSVVVRTPTGEPARGAAVTLGGSILLLTDSRGVARFARTERGDLDIDIQHPAVRERRLQPDPATGASVTGSRGP